MAPEVLKYSYDSKCDIWSCGVIMYILLCGYPPFNGKSDKAIMNRILKGKFVFLPDDWKYVSSSAKRLIEKALVYEPKKRMDAKMYLEDEWFKRFLPHKSSFNTQSNTVSSSKSGNPENVKKQALQISKNFKRFCKENKLQRGIMCYIANYYDLKDEKARLLKIFKEMDTNGDGMLNREELTTAYREIYSEKEALEEVNKIFETLDVNQSETIDFGEFVMANIDLKKVVNENRLMQIFTLVDKDGSGTISKEELVQFFNIGNDPESQKFIQNMVDEADKNGDGEISFQEFLDVMKELHKKM